VGSFPRITVVTPNFNQGFFLEQTIRSVLDQNYPNLEYIIMDGGSNDNSLDIIKKYESKLTYWESVKDNGMYDALNKGFSKSTGDIMCWINSDDVLWEGSFQYVSSLFSNNPEIQWIQGYPSVIDESGSVILQRDPIFSKFFFYLNIHETTLSFIQQESTFWSKELWQKSGAKLNLNYSLAADFDLWLRFFRFEKLYCTKRQLGAFRKRVNQKSSNIELYLHEAGTSLEINKIQLSILDKLVLILLNISRISVFFKKHVDFLIARVKYI
jgi:glycosyltransferase involved in cell wall biosynthesis